MTDSGEEHTYSFPVEDFDKSLLPPHARTPGTEAFREEVSKAIQRDFAEFTGWVRIIVSGEAIEVHWRQDPKRPTPMQVALGKIRRGDFPEAIRILDHLRRQRPNDVQVLYNLGLALSDLGQPPLAEVHLRAALNVDPDNVNAMVALGVSLEQQARTAEAIEVLRVAVEREPGNLWAHRNIGALLFSVGQIDEAAPHLRRAYELSPQDQSSAFGHAQALQATGKLTEAKELYSKAISLDEHSPIAELARREQTRLAESLFRQGVSTGVRSDAVAYCLDALQRFREMTPDQVAKISFEIAMLGRQGLDMDDADRRYTLKSLPGSFSGMNLVCLMYVASRQVAPNQPIWFDLSKEYEVARGMLEGEDKK